MKCQKCGFENPQGEIYCQFCGEELELAQPAPSPSPTVQQPTPAPTAPTDVAAALDATVPAGKKIATLRVDTEEYDLREDQELLVARQDTDKCQPDIALDDATVSSVPIRLVGNSDGTITVEDTGTSTGFRIVKLYKPGEKAELQIGDMLMIGKKLITVE